MAARKRSKKPVDDAVIGAAGERYLTALAGHRSLWATSAQLGFPSRKKQSAAVVKRLLAEKRILGVGKVNGAEAFTVLGSETVKERLSSVAARVVTEQVKLDRIDLLPLSAGAKRYAQIPMRVRDHIVPALQQFVQRKEAFPVKHGRSNFVVLLANLRALIDPTLAMDQPLQQREPSERDRASPERGPRPERERLEHEPLPLWEPQTDFAAPLDPSSVVRAYEQLAHERRSPNIIVAELQRESGVELETLQRWLLAECLAHRAVPLLGEPAHATPEQLAAALVVEGRPHLYVRLVQEQQA